MAASNILETFFILFKSNADDLKKGQEQAQRGSEDLEKQLGRTDAAGVAMGEHLMDTLTGLAAGFAALFTVGTAAHFVDEVAELNAELGLTSRRLGIGVADLYAWGQAAEETGGSQEGLIQSLGFLNRGMADIATKGTSRLKPFFDELEIDVTDAAGHVKPLLELMGELADALSKLSVQERAGIGEKLGLDEGLVLMLAAGRRGVDDLVRKQREMGTVTERDTEIAHAYGRSIEELGDRARLTATHFGSIFLPVLTEFFNFVGKIVDFLSAHSGLVQGFFIGLAGVLTTLYLPAAIEAAIATWAFLAPILAVVVPVLALAAAFAFLYDDVMNFLDGNQSVIGELSKTWPIIGQTIHGVIDGIGDIWQWFVDLLKGGASVVSGIAELIVAVWGRVTGAFDGFGEGLKRGFPYWYLVLKTLGSLLEWIAGIIGDVVGAIAQMVGAMAKFGLSAVGAIPSLLKSLGGGTHELAVSVAGKPPGGTPALAAAARGGLVAGQERIKTADSAPIAAQSSQSIRAGDTRSATNNTTVNAPITVNAAPGMSADDVGKAVARELGTHVRQAVNHSDDGVSH